MHGKQHVGLSFVGGPPPKKKEEKETRVVFLLVSHVKQTQLGALKKGHPHTLVLDILKRGDGLKLCH